MGDSLYNFLVSTVRYYNTHICVCVYVLYTHHAGQLQLVTWSFIFWRPASTYSLSLELYPATTASKNESGPSLGV